MFGLREKEFTGFEKAEHAPNIFADWFLRRAQGVRCHGSGPTSERLRICYGLLVDLIIKFGKDAWPLPGSDPVAHNSSSLEEAR